MTTYLVTLEIETPWWKKVLRFFRLVKRREDFTINLNYFTLTKGEILLLPGGDKLLILKKIKI
jgi:hypothetical protein